MKFPRHPLLRFPLLPFLLLAYAVFLVGGGIVTVALWAMNGLGWMTGLNSYLEVDISTVLRRDAP